MMPFKLILMGNNPHISLIFKTHLFLGKLTVKRGKVTLVGGHPLPNSGNVQKKVDFLVRFSHIKVFNALCCYPNVNGSVRNLTLNTSTAPIFLQFDYFRENIWVIIQVQFHFLYIFVGRVDRIRKNFPYNDAFVLPFPLKPPKFWGRVEQIFQNSPHKYLNS